jgi:pimeloyl-ACP methyl ester carboxylesterase
MRVLRRLVLLVVVLLVICGVTFYVSPIWFTRQQTHLGLFLARVNSNYVAMPEGRVHYYEAESRVSGGGIPLVLVHGLADRDESWAPMLKRLKRAGFHVYAPDLLGYGRSPKPENSDYSIATQEQFVADFIQALGLQKPNVGGWSMGGWIVLKLGLDHPDMVDRVVVYDAAGLEFEGADDRKALFRPQTPEDVNKLFAIMEPEAKPMPRFVAKDMMKALQAEDATAHKSVASMETRVDALDGKLQAFQPPLLIMWGALDKLIPLSSGQSMHAMVPHSELDIVEGCGHLAPLTCSSRVAAATADFLKANPAPQGQTRMLANMH